MCYGSSVLLTGTPHGRPQSASPGDRTGARSRRLAGPRCSSAHAHPGDHFLSQQQQQQAAEVRPAHARIHVHRHANTRTYADIGPPPTTSRIWDFVANRVRSSWRFIASSSRPQHRRETGRTGSTGISAVSCPSFVCCCSCNRRLTLSVVLLCVCVCKMWSTRLHG